MGVWKGGKAGAGAGAGAASHQVDRMPCPNAVVHSLTCNTSRKADPHTGPSVVAVVAVVALGVVVVVPHGMELSLNILAA